MEIHRSDFPPEFLFGAATSSYQIEGGVREGGRGLSNWDFLCNSTPGKAQGQNGNVACYSYGLYKEDVKICKKLGLDSYRFSISWSRVLPGGRLSAGVNREGIQYYNNLIDELLANGIQPFVTLHHFEVPQILEEQYGGFLDKRIIKDYLDLAELCFWEFGDRVKYWTTFNEPWTFIYFGYVTGQFPPCRGSSSEEHAKLSAVQHKTHLRNPLVCEDGDPGVEPYTAARNLLLAHAEAVDLYRKKFKAQGGQIGITLVAHWFEPFHHHSERDIHAAQRVQDFMLGWFMDPITYGRYPKSMTDNVPPERLQRFSEEESIQLRGSYDFLGLNYYTARYVVAASVLHSGPPSYITDQHGTQKNKGPDGNPIGEPTECDWLFSYPKGMHRILHYIKQRYNDPPIFITENGLADKNHPDYTVSEACNDETRIEYLREHLKEIRLAMIGNRVNVKGYFIWSLMDNFEWASGYNYRFGLVYVNFTDRYLSRFPKNSALWYMNFLDKKYRPIPHPLKNNALLEDETISPTSTSPLPYQTNAPNSGEMVVHEGTPTKRHRKT
ncbi:raucaffricine-O-beta-D-glucosidase [Coffea arabica]|uniref:Raucaffricine-O-beta-D-glucosidase n=1 Tax=Coffea arabica TaxID=13443 RepID=A0A6P6VZM2_COFAR|nr:raucaffricine-O-beta-D-glucosidase-like [Coffea arabica]